MKTKIRWASSVTMLVLMGCSNQNPQVQSAPGPALPSPRLKSPQQGAKDVPIKLRFADDIAERLKQFSPTDIDFDEKLLRPEDRRVLVKLVEAAQILDDIFFDQVSTSNRQLRQQLVQHQAPPAVMEYFDIMYGPWDRLLADQPFVGQATKPPGAGFYPEDLTKEQLEAWIKDHPAEEKAFHDYFTVIQRNDQGQLIAVPYAKAYADRLQRAATLLKDAAAISTHPALKKYLELRAESFLSNDYFESDMAWMDLGDSPLEVVLGPYEVYEDGLLGYKAAFEGFITLRDPDYSARLQKLAKHNLACEKNLPLPSKYFTKRGMASPISVVVELFTAGDAKKGVQTAAFNLPNDERVRTAKGSKKVMLKNVTEAKFQQALMPIAQRVLDEKLLPLINFDVYFTDILLHEIAHGMGPGQINVNGRQTEVNRELKELYPAIEECKADLVGLVNSQLLVRKGALPKVMAKQLPPTYVAGIFRAVRFGAEEAHAQAVLLAFNFLKQQGAITYDEQTRRFGIDQKKFFKQATELTRQLLLIQAHGNYTEAKRLLETYGHVSTEMKAVLATLKDVPVDIRPNFTILSKMKGW